MKLFYSETSPFARKVRMYLMLSKLDEQTELVQTSFTNDELRKENPLGKIPALVDDDISLFESDLICEYLDNKYQQNSGKSMFMRGSPSYFKQQLLAALANGITEAAVNAVFEARRETEPSTYWISRWHTAIEAAINQIDLEFAGDKENASIATVSLASALGYLDFRKSELDWRTWSPALANWFEGVSQTNWFVKTAPPKGA